MDKKLLKIRKARLSDVPKITELGLEILNYHRKLDDYFTPSKEAKVAYQQFFRKCIYSRKQLLLVAEKDDQIIGYALAGVGSRPPVFKIRKIGLLNDMYILPKYRRLGVGKDLYEAVSIWFKEKGLKYVHLHFHNNNYIGRKAWAKYGFNEFMSLSRRKI